MTERLDQIELILERMAMDSERSRQESNERMTRIDERLDRMVVEAERSKRESDERFEELTAVTQAIGRDMAQLITTHQQSSQALSQAMIRLADTQEGIARLLANLDEDRPTILRKLNTIEGKVDSLLERGNHSN